MRPSDARVASRRGLRLSLVVASLALVLAACASGAGSAPQAANPGGAREGMSLSRDQAAAPAPSADAGKGDLAEISVERQIVKTGDITIQVPNVATALASVRATALQLGGYVGGSQAGTLDESATLTLRIPAARFDDALAALHELDGKVIVEATREEDVTSAIVDLKARIANLQASEAQYRALLARAEKIEDVLSVQSRLDDVRGQIEQLAGQLKAVSGQADLATLTVSLTPAAQPVQKASAGWDPGAIASQALAALVEVGQAVASAAIWFAIVWLPIMLVLGIIALIVLRGILELRRRLPAPTPGDTPMG